MKTDYRSKIKLVVADVDGTLTDAGIYLTANGDEFKKFNARDGIGMKILMAEGIEVGIISASLTTRMVETRAQMLGIKYCYVGNDPKSAVLDLWRQELDLSYTEIAFLGDDINDKGVMELVGLSACPSDAVDIIKGVADIILEKKGGEGCFREFVDRFFPVEQ
ncbi:KdsC family phosphatase [Bacteroidota bacterium]